MIFTKTKKIFLENPKEKLTIKKFIKNCLEKLMIFKTFWKVLFIKKYYKLNNLNMLQQKKYQDQLKKQKKGFQGIEMLNFFKIWRIMGL